MKHSFKHKTISAILMGVLLASSGCVTTSDYNALQRELQQTRSRLNKKIDDLDSRTRHSEAEINQKINETDSIRSQQAGLAADVLSIKRDVAQLKGSVDSMSMNVNHMSNSTGNSTQTLEDLSNQIKIMQLALESQLAVDFDNINLKVDKDKDLTENKATSATVAAGIEAVVSPEKKEAPADPAKKLYDQALSKFTNHKYKEAIRDWAEFVKNFNGNKLVPNSIFWQGECYYQLGDYANAALKYQDVIAKYPKSTKLRQAMLKQGISLIKLNKVKPGKFILNDLIKKSPKSTEAKRAKIYLDNLK
ncbi:tol-pal system protein YbgF [Maridesulfovibrio bastinii]|uniref:tol-pal system protein YbgF n=1 Tax=Maridesulfovibrio bastinii TaxID=47157 RepID=UPI00042687F9|nr:tol-pal system protein YbgF [Maridesulfovibrio bastinii]